MPQEKDSAEGTPHADKDPFPVGKMPSAALQVQPIESSVPVPIIQQNIGPQVPDYSGEGNETKTNEPAPVRVVNDPLLTRVIEDDDLGIFERTTLRYAQWGVVVAAFTLLAVIGTAVVFWDQFQEMDSQTNLLAIAARQARADAKDAGIVAAKQLAIAQRQAQAAQGSVKAIQRQMRQDQRAFIQAHMYWKPTITEGQPINAQERFINTGKTPAKKIYGHIVLELVPNGKEPEFEYSTNMESWRVFSGYLLPNTDWLVTVPTIHHWGNHTVPEPFALTHDDWASLRNGDSFLVMHSYINYLDIFGVNHWIKTCDWHVYSTKPSGTFTAQTCPTYDDLDNNE